MQMSKIRKLLFAPSEGEAEVIGLVLIAIGFAIDAITGPNYSNLLFYIPPLTYVAWFSGSRVGWVYVGVVSIIIIVVHLLESAEIQDVRAADYNALTRIVTTAFVFWTVNKLRRTVVALRDANERLERLNEQKNLLFGVVSHDLKTPFNAILGYADLLERPPDKLPPERAREYAGRLGEAARRAFELLANLLRWAQLQMDGTALQPGSVEVRLLAERCVEVQRPAAALKGLEIVIDPIPAALRIYADFAAVQAVVRNLLANAIKFTLPGGRITIGARAVGDKVEISVADTGVGIAESRLPRLFSFVPDRSTLGTGGEAGTGLGLILCKDLVERSGGRLSVESQLGRGSRFAFTLPHGVQSQALTNSEPRDPRVASEVLPRVARDGTVDGVRRDGHPGLKGNGHA